jgi:hypothetical protein
MTCPQKPNGSGRQEDREMSTENTPGEIISRIKKQPIGLKQTLNILHPWAYSLLIKQEKVCMIWEEMYVNGAGIGRM